MQEFERIRESFSVRVKGVGLGKISEVSLSPLE
jgi:hypothetical protein